MKTLISLALGAVVLFGAATLQSGSVSARGRHDRDDWHQTHRHHHHYHHHHWFW